jgi:hypothetical protein
MGFKSDIQATRATAASSTAVVAPPVRLKGVIAANASASSGVVVMTTTQKTGTTLFTIDVPAGDVVNFSLPEDGILFPQGIFISTMTNVAAVTVLTDKYSGPELVGQNG